MSRTFNDFHRELLFLVLRPYLFEDFTPAVENEMRTEIAKFLDDNDLVLAEGKIVRTQSFAEHIVVNFIETGVIIGEEAPGIGDS